MLILLASAHNSVLDRWRGLLGAEDVLEQATTVVDLTRMAVEHHYDLILLHRLLVDSALCTEVRRLTPTSKLFLLSDQPHHEEGLTFLKLGIVGYANTYISPERMTEAVHVITSGGVWLGQKVIQQLILEAYNNAAQRGRAASSLEEQLSVMTRMERKVAEHVAQGRTNLEIAAELDIAERTVKAHLTAIYEKLRVSNRLSLALLLNQGSSR